MADETTDIQQQTEEVTPQQQGIKFEEILPWGTTGGDTGLSSRLKLKRNFDKIKTWIDSLDISTSLKDMFLSKKEDDEAQGLIGFLKGIWIKAQDLFYFDKDGNIRCHDINALGNIVVGELLTAKDITFSDVLKSDGASSGFTDGRGIYMDALQGLIETDGLNVRGFIRVMELIINRLQLMESDYSFTEGDTITHIDYEDNGQTLVLTMDKEQENKYTPFYEGDIIYLKKNDLLSYGESVPEGHTATRNGSYYTSWMWVKSVDLGENKIRVGLYPGKKSNGEPYVPGGINFSPHGTELPDTDITGEMAAEFEAVGTDVQVDGSAKGFDCRLTVTRHGNIANRTDDDHILQSQLGRQQAWVLSTTDQRLSFFWNVDEPIIHDENYALCLGILPDLANLPSTRNRDMPGLYINTLYFENEHQIKYPARVIKEDRGGWRAQPTARYGGEYEGTFTPDGSITDGSVYGEGITVHTGDDISDPYHCRTFSRQTWLQYRLSGLHSKMTDAQLRTAMTEEWKADLEVSRVWNYGILWECLVDGTAQEPSWNCTDWQPIGGDTVCYCEILSSAGSSFRNGNVDTILTMSVCFGQEDISQKTSYPQKTVTWKRMTGWDDEMKTFTETSSDRSWTPTYSDSGRLSIVLLRSDMGSGWMTDYRRAQLVCIIDEDGPEPMMAARRIL